MKLDIRFLTALFLFTLPIINPHIRGDGVGYYAYVRSIVIDRDLNFENEYRHGNLAFRNRAFDENSNLKTWLKMPNNFVRNQWAVGSSILWSPFFLIAHFIVLCLNNLGSNIPANGYSIPYRLLCAFGTMLYSFVGLMLAYQVAKKFASPIASMIATIGIWFGSSLPVYMYFLPFQAHALAAFSVSLFIWYWVRTQQNRTLHQWVLWGLMGGLVMDIYNINSIFLLLPIFDLIRNTQKQKIIKNLLINGTSFGIGACISLSPHWLTKWIIFGSPFAIGHDSSHPFFWSSPRLWNIGFSTEHGMFLWTPLLLLAIIGVILLILKESWIGGCLLATFIAYYYVISSYEGWHGLSSFGNRFFVAFSSIFVMGLAVFIDKIRISFLVSTIIVTFFICWNLGFIYQWGSNLVPNRGPVNFTMVAHNQIFVVPKKLGDFIFRYLFHRKEVMEDIEAEDIKESEKYQRHR